MFLKKIKKLKLNKSFIIKHNNKKKVKIIARMKAVFIPLDMSPLALSFSSSLSSI